MLLKEKDIQQVANVMMNMLHTEEIGIINDFYDALVAKNIEKIDDLFKVVLFDIEDHFSTEEEMMEESRYKNYQVHKNDHNMMREKFAKHHKQWQEYKNPSEMQEFLETEFKSWIVMHISKWDAETALHLGHAN